MPATLFPLTIGLFWHSMNSDNLGVGALTLAHMEILRAAARAEGREAHFLVLSWRDKRDWYLEAPDIENVPFRLRELVSLGGRVGDAIARCDLICDIGGGDSFTDIYGPKRFFTIWGAKARVLARGTPLILAPQTIGPFDKAWSRPLARAVMNRARIVATRDTPSTRFLGEMGVKADILEATDVAMRLPCDPAPARAEGPVRVGLNVSGLLFNGGYTGDNQFGLAVDYPALVRRIVRHFAEREGVELHLVGHVQSETLVVEDDQRVSQMLVEETPNAVLAPRFASPIEAKSYITTMDFFMGARMHATIAAFSSGVPVVPMAYSRKFSGVFGTLGYDRGVDLKTDDADRIMARIEGGFAERSLLSEEIADAMRSVDQRLDAYAERVRREIRSVNSREGGSSR